MLDNILYETDGGKNSWKLLRLFYMPFMKIQTNNVLLIYLVLEINT